MILGAKVVPKVESRDASPLGVASLGGKGGSYRALPALQLLPPSKTHVALAARWSPMWACDCPEQTRHARLQTAKNSVGIQHHPTGGPGH